MITERELIQKLIDKFFVSPMNCEFTVGKMHDETEIEYSVTYIIGDWNKPENEALKERFESIFNRIFINNNMWYYVEFVFEDEYTTCSDCGNLICTTPSSYHWVPDYWTGNGFIQCKTCAENDDFKSYIENLTNNSNTANVLIYDLNDYGFQQLTPDNEPYESGWFNGQTDNPSQILSKLMDKKPDSDFIFEISEQSQFYSKFVVWERSN